MPAARESGMNYYEILDIRCCSRWFHTWREEGQEVVPQQHRRRCPDVLVPSTRKMGRSRAFTKVVFKQRPLKELGSGNSIDLTQKIQFNLYT